MARTTLDIDQSVLREARRIAKAEGKSIGQVVSELAASALAERKKPQPRAEFRWISKRMRARVDLEDKDAVYDVLDRS